MQRNVRTIELGQQFSLVGVQPGQQRIEGGEPGEEAEDTVEVRAQLAAATRCRVTTIPLQVGIEPPDQRADTLLRDALWLSEGVELVHHPLGMYSTERMPTNIELAGFVADDRQCGVWAVAPDRFRFYSDVSRATQKQVLKLRSHPCTPIDTAWLETIGQ
jgi:hypothetical protein